MSAKIVEGEVRHVHERTAGSDTVVDDLDRAIVAVVEVEEPSFRPGQQASSLSGDRRVDDIDAVDRGSGVDVEAALGRVRSDHRDVDERHVIDDAAAVEVPVGVGEIERTEQPL